MFSLEQSHVPTDASVIINTILTPRHNTKRAVYRWRIHVDHSCIYALKATRVPYRAWSKSVSVFWVQGFKALYLANFLGL
jgi:hypothetical protein